MGPDLLRGNMDGTYVSRLAGRRDETGTYTVFVDGFCHADSMDDDSEGTLAAINARGRKKALRRFLLSLPPITVFFVSMGTLMWLGLGLLPAAFVTAFPVIGSAVLLEKLFPEAHRD